MLPQVVLVAWALIISCGAAQSVDYGPLNAALSTFVLQIDTSELEPVGISWGVFSTKVTFDESATCIGLGLDSVSVTGAPQNLPLPIESVNGSDYERYDIALQVDNFRFSCKIGVCIGLGVGCGDVTVSANSASNVDVLLEQQFYSEDFSTLPPLIARDKDTNCSDKVDLNGATFVADEFRWNNLFAIDGIIEGQLNGGQKARAVEPISDAICEQLANITAGINNLVVTNQFANRTLYGLGQNKSIGEEAAQAEREIEGSLPAGVDLIDIGDNFLVNTLFGGAQNGSLVLDPSSTFVETALGFLNISAADNSNTSVVLALIDSFLGTDIADTDGQFQDLDIIEVIRSQFLPNITDYLSIEIDLAELFNASDSAEGAALNGTVSGSLRGLYLSATPSSTEIQEQYSFPLFGNQTIAIPQLDLGDLRLVATLELEMDVELGLLDSAIAVATGDEFSVSLSWLEFLAQVAVFLPLDGAKIPELEVGGLLTALVNCVLSLFHVSPMITGAFVNAGGIDLLVFDVTDGLIKIVGDLLNSLSPMFQGVIPGTITQAFESALINTALLDTIPECPATELNANTSQPFSLADNPLLSAANGLASLEAVNSALEGFTGSDLVNIGADGLIELVPEPIALSELELPQTAGSPRVVLSLQVRSLTVEGVLPPSLSELNLFNVSDTSSLYYPQGMLNALTAGSAENPLAVTAVVVIDVQDGLLAEGGKITSHNDLSLGLSSEGLRFVLELFLALSIFDVEATQVRDLLNLDCWISKLDPYGGIKQLLLRLAGLDISFDCSDCDNLILGEFASMLSKPENAVGFVRAINNVTELLGSKVTELFDEPLFNETIAKSSARCADPSIPGSFLDDLLANLVLADVNTLTELPTSEQDLSSTYAFVGGFFAVLGLAGFLTCGCRVGPEARLLRHGHGAAVDDSLEEKLAKAKSGRPAGPAILGSSSDLAVTPNPLCPAQVRRDSTEKAKDHTFELEQIPLWRHPHVPKLIRVGLPFVLLVNFVMFLLGHIDVVLQTDLVGSFLGIPLALDNFAELSVIETVSTLIEGGAYLLAALLGGFSVLWPYVKLGCLTLCWFLPGNKLGFSKRGSILVLLDQLGKWSLVELYFVAFVNTLLRIDAVSPPGNNLLPEGAFSLSIVIELLFNLYTFTAALLLSLLVSNIAMVYHERIEDGILEIKRSAQGYAAADHTPLSLRNYLFERKASNGILYRAALSQFGAILVLSGMVASLLLLAYAGTLPVLELKIFGLIRPLLEFTDGPQATTQVVTFYSFIQDSFSIQDFGVKVFAGVVVLTVLVIPVIQAIMLMFLPFVSFTLKGASRFLEVNQVLCAWCATEVFVLAIAVTTLELKTVSKFLVEENCEVINPILLNVLYPSGLFDITLRDVESSCFGMEASVQIGAYVFFAGLVINNFVHLFITKLFKAYIENRKHSAAHFEAMMLNNTAGSERQSLQVNQSELPKLGCGISTLQRLRLITVERPSEAEMNVSSAV